MCQVMIGEFLAGFAALGYTKSSETLNVLTSFHFFIPPLPFSSLSLPLCLSPLPLPVKLIQIHHSISLGHSFCLSRSFSVTHSLCLTRSLSFSFQIFLTRSHYHSFSFQIFLTRSHCHSFSLTCSL